MFATFETSPEVRAGVTVVHHFTRNSGRPRRSPFPGVPASPRASWRAGSPPDGESGLHGLAPKSRSQIVQKAISLCSNILLLATTFLIPLDLARCPSAKGKRLSKARQSAYGTKAMYCCGQTAVSICLGPSDKPENICIMPQHRSYQFKTARTV